MSVASVVANRGVITPMKPRADVLSVLRQGVKGSSASNRKTFYIKPDQRRRVRFLVELDRAVNASFHEDWDAQPVVNTMCWKQFGRDDCPYCDNGNRVRDFFCWPVYDYESGEVQIFRFKATKASPIKALLSFNDTYGNITDRDYDIQRQGGGKDTQYSVVPLDKGPFRPPKKVSPWNENQIMEALAEEFVTLDADREALFGSDADEDDTAPPEEDGDSLFADDEEADFEDADEVPSSRASAKAASTNRAKAAARK